MRKDDFLVNPYLYDRFPIGYYSNRKLGNKGTIWYPADNRYEAPLEDMYVVVMLKAVDKENSYKIRTRCFFNGSDYYILKSSGIDPNKYTIVAWTDYDLYQAARKKGEI